MAKFFDGAAEILFSESGEVSIVISRSLSKDQYEELSKSLFDQKVPIGKINLHLKTQDPQDKVELDDNLLALVTAHNPTAFKLNYFPRGFREKTLKNLAILISSSPNLKDLDLSDLMLKDKGAALLQEAITDSSLTKLNLSGNEIGSAYRDVDDQKMRPLLFILEKNKSLIELNLSVNNIGHEDLSAITKALAQNNTLEHLNLVSNRVKTFTADIKKIQKEAKELAKEPDIASQEQAAKAKIRVKSFKKSDAETELTFKSLQQGNLKTLRLSGNLIDSKFAQKLAADFSTSDITLTLNHQGGEKIKKDEESRPTREKKKPETSASKASATKAATTAQSHLVSSS